MELGKFLLFFIENFLYRTILFLIDKHPLPSWTKQWLKTIIVIIVLWGIICVHVPNVPVLSNKKVRVRMIGFQQKVTTYDSGDLVVDYDVF